MTKQSTLSLIQEQLELIEANSEEMYKDTPDFEGIQERLRTITYINTLIYNEVYELMNEGDDTSGGDDDEYA